jgi:ribonuclease BN (tRNA processing enzyme)
VGVHPAARPALVRHLHAAHHIGLPDIQHRDPLQGNDESIYVLRGGGKRDAALSRVCR